MISTSRLLMRRFSLADVPKLFAMSREAALGRWIPDQVYRDLDHAEQVARALIAHSEGPPDPRTRPYVLGVEDRTTGALIGHVGLSAARDSVEIGYAIEEQLQGKGLATEAVRAVADWALASLSLPEVLGVVAAENAASCRVLAKAGFVLATEEIKHVEGRPRTIRIYRRS